ncbi:MAG: hypothetical protein Q3983_07700 [Capnocytophaga sp.]|nr:hypothetical protein [Capnocytophaga sp.]
MQENILKNTTILLRISSIQKEKWKKICVERKITLTDFIISSVEDKMTAQERREVLKFIEKQENIFAKIGNNINQFAHIANAKKDIYAIEFQAFVVALQQIERLKEEQNRIFKQIYKLMADDC